ncbi:MAG: glycine cleavage T C-terminal barrel domain-containing protein [Phycisphaeraceae bacterium]
MGTSNPLRRFHEQAEATFLPYGPASRGGGARGVEIVQTFQAYEAEYAAIRKTVGVLDMPQRGLVELRGGDRLDFLHRMTTHDTNSLKPGQGRRAFLLNAKGRISADLIVLTGEDRTLLDLDAYQAETVTAELDRLLFAEDVQLQDVSDGSHHLALHGPGSVAVVNEAGSETVAELKTLGHRNVTIDGHRCTVYRRDDAGSPALHLIAPVDGIEAVYRKLMEAVDWDPQRPDDEQTRATRRGRPIGWLAYNTARIEAQVPIYHIDFGPDSLPHETGPALLDEAVSFTKGCYVGQEIVARMQNLGHPKKLLVGLKLVDDRMPIAGAQVLDAAEGCEGEVVGAVTSSTVSPLRGNVAVAIAMVKWGKHHEGTQVQVPAEGQVANAVVERLGSE